MSEGAAEKNPASIDTYTPWEAGDLIGSGSNSCSASPHERVISRGNHAANEPRVWNYREREISLHKPKRKNSPWPTKLSKKRRDRKRRAPVRDSKRVYHTKTVGALLI